MKEYPNLNLSQRELLEHYFALYQKNPEQVSPSWRAYFQSLDNQLTEEETVIKEAPDSLRIYHLIEAYRTYGHLMAKVNPLATEEPKEPWQLSLKNLGFKNEELETLFPTCGLLEEQTAPLTKILSTLKEIYCGSIGVEYMGRQNPDLELWLQERIEPTRCRIDLSIDQKRTVLQYLNKSELFEVFLHTKYTGQKRFSIEGGETIIPMIAFILEKGAGLNLDTFVLGMAHRGRLNLLSNILQKSYTDIFSEFEEGFIPTSFEGSGDVKYHKGFSSTRTLECGKNIDLFLAPNPSHLESVNPVVEGQTFALQGDDHSHVIPILIHGDAALAGQGVVYETMQLSKLKGYCTGGTLHIVINNQIGFTTLPEDSRSTHYCTDISKTFGAPVFHVNAEDPEACVFATLLAVEIRQKFHCDVFLDLFCYRKYGHNESDEPAFTQPIEYKLIRKKSPIRELYRDDLIQQGVLERQMAEALEEEFKKSLHHALEEIKIPKAEAPKKEKKFDLFAPQETGAALETLQAVAKKMVEIPEGFTLHSKLKRLMKDRLAMAEGGLPLDWGMAETLAYGSLLWEGVDVRLAGQDCGRGTFSHRHALLMDQAKEFAYFPLQHLKEDQGHFDVINSPLSENAALGFELGYNAICLDSLTIWEAQFGDFANGAQVIIDQYLATAEQKWGQKSSLTLLLPHGYEGQGPEHSSARIERFLTLCGNDNMLVANPTTPAQLFHLLRRQVKAPFKKPLIVFTPKGLLRLRECTSAIEDLTQGSFQEIYPDPKKLYSAKRLLLCSGRIYYDLDPLCDENTSIIRIEQLYPLHKEKLKNEIAKYKNLKEICYVQEEPSNMGAWEFLQSQLDFSLTYVGRPRSAASATGSFARHKMEHQAIIDTLFSNEYKEEYES